MLISNKIFADFFSRLPIENNEISGCKNFVEINLIL